MTQSPKGQKPKRKSGKPKLSDKEQSERFIEAAQAHGLDENVEEVDTRLEKVIARKNYNSGN